MKQFQVMTQFQVLTQAQRPHATAGLCIRSEAADPRDQAPSTVLYCNGF